MRNLVAVLTMISMLHLTLVCADLACASHSMATSEAMVGMGDVAGAAHHDSGMQNVVAAISTTGPNVAGAADCTTPVQPRCCEAMSSCSVTTTVSAAMRLVSYCAPSGVLLGDTATEPTSFRSPPEPPPPKA